MFEIQEGKSKQKRIQGGRIMATYKEALDCMCRRRMNFAVCNATGCEPKRKLQELIDSVNEKENGDDI